MTAVIKARCCVSCDECRDCYSFSVQDVRDLINAIDYELSEYGKSLVQKINWGYACSALPEPVIDKLRLLRNSIVRFYNTMRHKIMPCLCDVEFQKIKEAVSRITDLRRCGYAGVTDIVVDDSGAEAWALQHPGCVPYEDWEACVRNRIKSLVIAVDVVADPLPVRTIHALAKIDGGITRVLARAAATNTDQPRIGVKVSAEQCGVEYNAMPNKLKAGVSKAIYSKVRGCGHDSELIARVVGCGAGLGINGTGSAMLKIGAEAVALNDVINLAGGIWPENQE